MILSNCLCLLNKGAEDNDGDSPRKRKRKIIKDSKLQEETKAALEAEEARRKRVKEKQKLYNNVGTEEDPNSPVKCPKVTSLVLDRDEKKEPLVQVEARWDHLRKQVFVAVFGADSV